MLQREGIVGKSMTRRNSYLYHYPLELPLRMRQLLHLFIPIVSWAIHPPTTLSVPFPDMISSKTRLSFGGPLGRQRPNNAGPKLSMSGAFACNPACIATGAPCTKFRFVALDLLVLFLYQFHPKFMHITFKLTIVLRCHAIPPLTYYKPVKCVAVILLTGRYPRLASEARISCSQTSSIRHSMRVIRSVSKYFVGRCAGSFR